jgi:hypothetical protein
MEKRPATFSPMLDSAPVTSARASRFAPPPPVTLDRATAR